MYDIFSDLKPDIKQLISGPLYQAFEREIHRERELLASLASSLRANLEATSDNTQALSHQKATSLELLNDAEEITTSSEFADFAPEFTDALGNRIYNLPVSLKVEQAADRFKGLSDDPPSTRLLKLTKRISFKITDTPRRAANVFRRQKHPRRYWSHCVPLRRISKLYFERELTLNLIGIRTTYLPTLSQAYQLLMECSITSSPVPDGFLGTLDDRLHQNQKELKEALEALFEDLWRAFLEACEKADTWEQKGSPYEEGIIEKRLQSTLQQWETQDRHWSNTFDVLFEEWRSDMEVETLVAFAERDLETFDSSLKKQLDDSVFVQLHAVSDFINSTRKEVKPEDEELLSKLKKINYQAQKQLDEQLMPKLMELLTGKSMLNSLARLQNDLTKALDRMITERKIAKNAIDYLSPLPDSEIATISLHELIAFEILPTLNTKLEHVRSFTLDKLNSYITLTGDLNHIISFGISSAIKHAEEDPKDLSGTYEIVTESLDRCQQRIEEVQSGLNELRNEVSTQIGEAVKTYAEAIQNLTNNENVRTMRMRILKAKAVQQTKAYRQQLVEGARQRMVQAKSVLTRSYQNTIDWLGHTRERFLITAKKETPSREISDFLSESQEIINALPVIYRNLYRIEPVADMELFVGRQQEYAQLTKAYDAWNVGRMSSAALTGEKWSGLTSMVNFTSANSPFNYPVARLKCMTSINATQQLIEFFHTLIDVDTDDLGEIAQALNEGTRRVIIMEDLQNLYLRRIGGFNTLSELLALISKTSKNVFWVTTCTIYAWEYFTKTIHIQDVFSYHIPLQKPSEEELSAIVEKRNRISGYKIHFEADSTTASAKKFTKLSVVDQQAFLKKRFFASLIDFSESNISMALTFWLLSTKKIDKNEIIISEFKKPNLNFLQLLSLDKIMALHLLILHDGLTLEQFELVHRSGKQHAFFKLSMMLEDGILIQKNEHFLVNPLVYRSIISLLKSKNLIH
ncbi:ATP-binding protein [Marinoscillum furvescens]|uniref:Uncharacterized protein n=1 Tax=Marinoscillum furvescens DSM 4134 TaxID=1122208 RepID=A0A3D9L0Q0_MARFU|nr:ATP-binding protein [Marinoscillum furvescens]RED97036.1 hypothetical protein C7460_11385 [Marinoscillum furvescens DSM 4134]